MKTFLIRMRKHLSLLSVAAVLSLAFLHFVATPALALRPNEGIMNIGNPYLFSHPYGCLASTLTCSIPINAQGGPFITRRYVCDGKNPSHCVDNEDRNSTIQNGISSISVYRTDPGCNKTIQIDVFQENIYNDAIGSGTNPAAGSWIVYYTGDCPTNQCPAEAVPVPPKFTSPAMNAEVTQNSNVTLQWTNPASFTNYYLEVYDTRFPRVDLTSLGGYYDNKGNYNANANIAFASSTLDISSHQWYSAYFAFDVKTYTFRDYGIPDSNALVDTRTGWWSAKTGSGVVGEWLAYKFETPMVVRFVQLDQFAGTTQVSRIAVDASTNGTSWTTLKELDVNAQVSNGVAVSGDLDTGNNTAYQYYRVRALTGTSKDQWGVLDLDLKGPTTSSPKIVEVQGTSYALQAASANGYYVKIYGNKAGQCRPLWSNPTALIIRTKPPETNPAPPTLSAACSSDEPIVNINWSGTFTSDIWVDFDDDSNHNNGYWNYNVKTPNQTRTAVAPTNFVTKWFVITSKQESAAPPVMQANKTYYVRIFDTSKQLGSEWVTVSTKTCATATVPPTAPPTAPPQTVSCRQTCDPLNNINCATGFVCAWSATEQRSLCLRQNAGCSYGQQDAQCNCPVAATEPPKAPACTSLSSSNRTPKVGDSVTFTCATVSNAVRYEFQSAYSNPKTSSNADVLDFKTLASATATSNQSVALTVDRPGRYVVQCRPCAANNLCGNWETATAKNQSSQTTGGAQ